LSYSNLRKVGQNYGQPDGRTGQTLYAPDLSDRGHKVPNINCMSWSQDTVKQIVFDLTFW